ncbi:hypothetical protein DYBT9275_00073 [Dyadobacter sp. CECT 9275]|uniref:Peptidase M56 domain-containing protein n=1 Tax=Dyadobacter helix TaxID=2822344 RepID=A0A916J7V4_9BACT|nr:M56 family metallopeptidase [Dyadobacter sp. CECT 9275]CAG4988398.1 hypothetical protein DYBT9275_00073 [Dyadobacter sp. CECT 9275]
MAALPGFLWKANVIFTVLFAAYYLLLRKEKFLVFNRFLLAGIFLLALTLPLCPNLVPAGIDPGHILKAPVTRFYTFFETSIYPDRTIITNRLESTDLSMVATAVYLLVITFLLIKLLFQVLKILGIVSKSKRSVMQGMVYCEPIQELPPFSFFRYIVISGQTLNPEQYRYILTHELCHCRQLHSIDVLLTELARILFWFNPLVYVYRDQVKLNLEFLADEQVIRGGADRKAYQLSLLSLATGKPLFNMTNAFYSSKIKRRISMMNIGLGSGSRYKYAVIAPLILISYMLINWEPIMSMARNQILIPCHNKHCEI